MSLRKVAGLLGAFGLIAGLIGGGVGAAFTDSVKAVQNINVGTFQCQISNATAGTIAADKKSVLYTAPTIVSSDAASAPFSFTVQNTGSIAAVLTVSTAWTGNLTTHFSDMMVNPGPQAVAPAGSFAYSAGVQWTSLDNTDRGTAGAITYTINCNENGPTVVFDNHPALLPGNLPSQAFQATQTSEWGTQVTLAGTARHLTQAVVTMSTWAPRIQWPSVGTAAGWSHDFTLNLYNVNGANPNRPGTLIKSVTQSFTIPWRPVADPTCADTGYGAGFAWRAGNGTCYNGFAFNITFDLSAQNIVAADNLIFGIAYNTQSYGSAPIGTDGPYNSLNVAMFPGTNTPAGVQASVGTFADPTIVFWNTATAGWYTDGGAGGVGVFRSDSNWGGYQPAVQFTATN